MAEDRLSQIYEDRMGANVGAAAVAYLASQYEELKTPNIEARNKLADFLENQPPELQEKICVLPIKMASVKEQMKNAQNIAEADAEIMQKHQYMYADINQVVDRTMPTLVKWAKTMADAEKTNNENEAKNENYNAVYAPEYGITSNDAIVYMAQMVYNEHLPPKDCDAAQAQKEINNLSHNVRAYQQNELIVEDKIKDENGPKRVIESKEADTRTSFGRVIEFMDKYSLQASQAMQVLGETVANYANLPAEERAKYVAMAEKFPQEVKVAAYVAQAREQAIASSELFNQQMRQPDIVMASRMLDENALTPPIESVEKAMFAYEALLMMNQRMAISLDLESKQGQEYMKTAQKFGESALIAVCTAASAGEKIESPKDLMTRSLKSFKLMQYMHDERYPSRRLSMKNLYNAAEHVQAQQKTYNARLMLQNSGYHLG